ncbi:phosphoadenosine phosphosulfate reductase family protein [Gordonia bronchialis]|uniref:phosphoadenosine phosphosulfate reductase domain-containing protein n=1 Tax=Gordonia bronchialis TaxID=2054 RepID=UPI001CBBE36C|nr:phosphoadenosine phosphosulfate reductase family protein [Gordonia bronchialis]UAK39457.1 phosphoadenosine phosphosulfate reductase family protein [Gordonia bronchialis]
MSTSGVPDPGLDLTTLRAVRGRRFDATTVLEEIADYRDRHDGMWVAWSGGKDSTVVVDLARRVDPEVPVVFYDCGLDFPETRTYLVDLAAAWELDLHVVPTEPDLLTLLIAAGDFDPAAPTRRFTIDMRVAMIAAPASRAHTVFGPANLWGVRADESAGRRHLYRTQAARNGDDSPRGMVRRGGGTTSFGPIWNWSTEQVWQYSAARDIPPNPLYAKLASLGADTHTARVNAMIDPSRLDNGHIARLAAGWPDIYTRLVEALPRLDQYR